MAPIANRFVKLQAYGLCMSIALILTGCTLPGKRLPDNVYDFGPGAMLSPTTERLAPQSALALGAVQTSPALDSTAVLYRLAYKDAQQLKPYAQARWSMAPAQLVRQRLSEHLSQGRALLSPGDIGPVGSPTPPTLRVELEEFSHLFETPTTSVGLLRLRVTLVQPSPSGERLIAQRKIIVQQPALTADAAGGVRALTAAADSATLELTQWLLGLAP